MRKTRNSHDARSWAGLTQTREEERDKEVRAEVISANLRLDTFSGAAKVNRLSDHDVLDEDLHERLEDGSELGSNRRDDNWILTSMGRF